jgi:hypothetical protein
VNLLTKWLNKRSNLTSLPLEEISLRIIKFLYAVQNRKKEKLTRGICFDFVHLHSLNSHLQTPTIS